MAWMAGNYEGHGSVGGSGSDSTVGVPAAQTEGAPTGGAVESAPAAVAANPPVLDGDWDRRSVSSSSSGSSDRSDGEGGTEPVQRRPAKRSRSPPPSVFAHADDENGEKPEWAHIAQSQEEAEEGGDDSAGAAAGEGLLMLTQVVENAMGGSDGDAAPAGEVAQRLAAVVFRRGEAKARNRRRQLRLSPGHLWTPTQTLGGAVFESQAPQDTTPAVERIMSPVDVSPTDAVIPPLPAKRRASKRRAAAAAREGGGPQPPPAGQCSRSPVWPLTRDVVARVPARATRVAGFTEGPAPARAPAVVVEVDSSPSQPVPAAAPVVISVLTQDTVLEAFTVPAKQPQLSGALPKLLTLHSPPPSPAELIRTLSSFGERLHKVRSVAVRAAVCASGRVVGCPIAGAPSGVYGRH